MLYVKIQFCAAASWQQHEIKNHLNEHATNLAGEVII